MKFTFADRMQGMKGSAIREIFKLAGKPGVISFGGGSPATEMFPNEELAEIARDVLRNQPALALQYGVTEGYPKLRELVRARLLEKEKIGRDFDDLLIVTGGQQGIEHAAKVLLNEGDTALVEEPTFIGGLNAFRSYNANVVGVPLKEDGMDLDALEAAIAANKNVKLLYTIPTYQNPTGITMPVEKRRRLYEICRKNGVVILEDNPYGELRYEGEKVPTIKSMDSEGIVIYCGSFSKILSPGLRLGFVCAPKEILERMTVNKQISDVHTSMLPQLLAAEFLSRYNLDDYIEKMRTLYRHRCQFMIEQIDKCFPEQCTHTNPKGGLFIWCDLGGGYDTMQAAAHCAEHNVVFVPGSTFLVDQNAKSSAFRLNFSSMSDEMTEKGIAMLGEALYALMK